MNEARAHGPLGGLTRFSYGVGLGGEGIKNGMFNLFLLFYYQQVVGLAPMLCGAALFIALCVDAVADPLIGIWSDGCRSRLGRRHPFMYAACVPLAACFLGTFSPPQGLGQASLFLWLLVFATATRLAMALFVIPHQTLVAELSADYVERTGLQTLRTVSAWFFALLNAFLAYRVFLVATPEYPRGMLNPAGYPPLVLCGAVLMLATTLLSALGTQKAALARQPDLTSTPKLTPRQLPGALRSAWRSPSYRSAALGGLCVFVAFGVAENLNGYLQTFFWQLTSEQIAAFVPVIVLSLVVALVSVRALVSRFGKRWVALLGAVLPAVVIPLMIALRVAGILPANEHPAFLPLLMGSAFFAYGGFILAMTMTGAMIADVTDEHELATGSRQEGLLFSLSVFLSKVASGAGVLVASLVVSLAQIQKDTAPELVDPGASQGLGVFWAVLCAGFGAAQVFYFRRYGLGQAQHRSIAAKLLALRGAPRASHTVPDCPRPPCPIEGAAGR